MLEPQLVARLRAALISTAGGYLRNPIRKDFVTCAICTTPVSGYAYCYPCNESRAYGGLAADIVAPLAYAVAGRQSGYVMRTYKAQPPVDELPTDSHVLLMDDTWTKGGHRSRRSWRCGGRAR